MNDERVASALRVLREEGLEIRLTPEAVFMHVNRLEVACPSRSSRDCRIIIDGKEIQNLLYAIEVKLTATEPHDVRIVLGGFQ